MFRPYPDYCHVLFMRQEGRYLHTVGDYPAYALEIPRNSLTGILSGYQSNSQNSSDLFERFVNVRLRTELETALAIYRDYSPSALEDLEGLTSDFYVANRLESFCRHLPNRFGRFAACLATAQHFGGRV